MIITIKDKWRQEINTAFGKHALVFSDIRIDKHPRFGPGYYSSPILFEMAEKMQQSAMHLGLQLKNKMPSCIGLKAPGFLNFCCTKEALWQWLLLFECRQVKMQPNKSLANMYQRKRLNFLLSPFGDLDLATYLDYLELGQAEYELGLLLMDAVDASIHHGFDKTQGHFIQGLDDYLNRMVFLSDNQSIMRAKCHLLTVISDFLI